MLKILKRVPQNQPQALPTYIAAATELNGTLHAENNLLVDGIVHGSVEVRGDMEISAGALVEGPQVRARNLTVHGVLKAQVQVDGKLTLSRTARLEGDVSANSLSIENGAYYIGHITTGDVKTLSTGFSRAELASTNGNY